MEKIQLPEFGGDIEDYFGFKSLFRQLCSDECYAPEVELALLREKLPKRGVTAIKAKTHPEGAWKRLDKLYGDKEALVVAAITRLRKFLRTKSTPHVQILEIVAAVQRCCAVLEGLGEVRALYSDHVTMTMVIQSLPIDFRVKWFNQPDSDEEDPYRRAEHLVKWLETERKFATWYHSYMVPASAV